MQHQRFAFLWTALSTFILVASISCATAFAQDTSATIWPTKGWQTSTPEEQGMSSAALAGLLDFGMTLSFDSLLIARHGKIVLDAYYAPYTADIPHVINAPPMQPITDPTAATIPPCHRNIAEMSRR